MSRVGEMKHNNKSTLITLCGVIILNLFMAGCIGGSRGYVRFDELKYPASMSSFLYGPNDEILTKDRDLIVVKRFRFEVYYTAIFYSLLPPSHTHDVGDQINTEIVNGGGDGVVNVKISSNPGITAYLHPLTLVPFWPSYTTVVVEGDIVKFEPTASQVALKTSAFDITDDILIIETTDESATLRLNEQCHVISTIDTLFAEDAVFRWKPNAQSWKTMRPADRDGWDREETMQDHVKMAARTRGANVAQILYVTLDHNEVRARTKQAVAESSYSGNVALDIRYWSCPKNHLK